MRVLFIGGTGVISSACTREAVDAGLEVHLLCRGETRRTIPESVTIHHADIRNPSQVANVLGRTTFDAVVDFVAFTPEHVETDLSLFRGRIGQYVFISSASAYHKPVVRLPITEATPLHNPYWQYSRDKIACEALLTRAYHDDGLPLTIVRPSHTYDETLIPFEPSGYTVLDRMRRGLSVVVHGDGTSLWVLTHHRDFARGFVPLLGHPQAFGEAFHITADEALPWNEIYHSFGRALGVEPKLVHVPSTVIARHHAPWGAGLLGDKSHSVVFDNSKIRRLVPNFTATISIDQGAREIVAHYERNPGTVDESANRLLDRLVTSVS